MFYLAPDGITVREANGLLDFNASNCIKQTTTTPELNTQTTNMVFSTTSAQTEPTMAPCDNECQSEINKILSEIIELEKTCKIQELPPEAVGLLSI